MNAKTNDISLKEIKDQAHAKSSNFELIDIKKDFLYPSDQNLNLVVTCESNDKNLRELLSENCYRMSITRELNKNRLHNSEPFIMSSEDAIQGIKIIEQAAKLDPDQGKTLKIGFSFYDSIGLPQKIDYKSINDAGSVMKAYAKQVEKKIDEHFNNASWFNNDQSTDKSELTASQYVALYSKAFKVEIVDQKINNYLKENHLEGAYERSTDRAFKGLENDLNEQLVTLKKSQSQYGNQIPEVLNNSENELLGQLKSIGGVNEKSSGFER